MAKKRIVTKKQIEESARLLLQNLGLDLTNHNFQETPRRVAKMLYEEVTFKRPNIKCFYDKTDEIILVKDHLTFTRCPHHLERVKLKVSFAYLPYTDEEGKALVVGISKIPRIIDYLSAGFKLQETLGSEICRFFINLLTPKGCACYIVGDHACMQTRGVRSPASTITSCMQGIFREDPRAREEFMFLVKGGE